MASVTLQPTTAGAASWTSAPNNVLNDGSDSTYGYDDTNSTGTYDQDYNLNATPADFTTMDTLSVQARVQEDAPDANLTWDDLRVIIYGTGHLTLLAALNIGASTQSLGDPPESSTPSNLPSTPQSFGYINTAATKSDWDGATITIAIIKTRQKGGGSVQMRVLELTLSGTYTPASPGGGSSNPGPIVGGGFYGGGD